MRPTFIHVIYLSEHIVLLVRVAGASDVLSNDLIPRIKGVVRPQRFEAMEVLSDALTL